MLRIGCHLSSSKGFLAMGKEAVRIGANTFQFFSRNPRGGAVKQLNMDDVTSYIQFTKENDISNILAHAPYTLNACAKDKKIRTFAIEAMADDISRLANIPNCMYNFHPGSHVGQGVDTGIDFIVEILNEIITPDQSLNILLETMAGKGSEIGRSFEEIQAIISKIKNNERIGVCFDTCHVYDSGYDILNNLDGILSEFDKIIGLDRLKAVHLNDSKNPIGSHKDRHEKIGDGSLGINVMEQIINHPALRTLPFYLETPNDVKGYEKEIGILRNLYKEMK